MTGFQAPVFAFGLALLFPTVVLSQNAPGPPSAAPASISVSAAIASDYVFRGLDRSLHEPSASVGVDVGRGDLYAGGWAANVHDFSGGREGAEADLYAGWRPSLYGFDVSLGGIYYGFVDQPGRLSFVESYAKASRGLGPLSFAGAVYLSPSYSGRTGFGAYLEESVSYAATPALTLSATLGRQAIADAPSYTTWSLVGAYALGSHVSLELRYSDTDHSDGGYPYHARAVAAVKANF